jgi:hypothetical protein
MRDEDWYRENKERVDRFYALTRAYEDKLAREKEAQEHEAKEYEKRRAEAAKDANLRFEQEFEDNLARMFPGVKLSPEFIKAQKYVAGVAAQMGAHTAREEIKQVEVARKEQEIAASRENFFGAHPELSGVRREIEYYVDERGWELEPTLLKIQQLHPELAKPKPSPATRPRDPYTGTFIESPAGGNAAPAQSAELDATFKRIAAQMDAATDDDALFGAFKNAWK